jgi:hypothetical protein
MKTVLKMLTTAQCSDREKVLYAAGRLQGSAATWWDTYVDAHATPDAITWDEFAANFRSHHIPAGLMKMKKKEFLFLKQAGMSVAEYIDKFIELSCYAPEEVADDGKKQEMFLDGLSGPLQYLLMSHVFPTFQSLVDSAIRLEYKRRELGEQNRKATSQGQSGSVTRPRFAPQQNMPFRYGGSGGNYGQQQSPRPAQPFQQTGQQFQQSTPQTPRPTFSQIQQKAPMGTLVRVTTPPNPANTTCFKCGELGHYANVCPQRQPPSTPMQNQQGRNGNQTLKTNKGQQSYSHGKVNQVDAEAA